MVSDTSVRWHLAGLFEKHTRCSSLVKLSKESSVLFPPPRYIPSIHQEVGYTAVLSLGTSDIWSGLLSLWWVLSYALWDATHQMPVAPSPPAVTTQSVFRHCQMIPGGHDHS